MKREDNNLLIVGAGGHGRVVADAASCAGSWSKIAFIDDRYPEMTESGNWPVIGAISDLKDLIGSWDELVVAIGENGSRLRIQNEASDLGFPIAIVIHPSAQIAKDARIGEGTVVFANAVVNTGSVLGRSVIINTSAVIDHDGTIGDGVHISPGAKLAGNVEIGRLSWVGIGAAIINNIVVGEDVTVGAGAAVIADVAANSTVVGVPAKPI